MAFRRRIARAIGHACSRALETSLVNRCGGCFAISSSRRVFVGTPRGEDRGKRASGENNRQRGLPPSPRMYLARGFAAAADDRLSFRFCNRSPGPAAIANTAVSSCLRGNSNWYQWSRRKEPRVSKDEPDVRNFSHSHQSVLAFLDLRSCLICPLASKRHDED